MASDVSITIGVDNKQAVSGLKQVGDESEKTGSRAAGALGKMGGALGDVAKIASGFVIGAGLMKLPGFLIGAAQAAADDEAATARLHQTFKNYANMVGAESGTFEALNSLLTERIAVGQKLAFSDDEVRNSFNALLVATDDSTEATKRQAAAFDLARGANIPLEAATKLLGKITAENVEVFKRMGITIGENATEADALAAVQARFGGQADAYAKSTAGQFAQAKIAMSEIVESIGGAVLPVFTKLADFASENLPKVQEVIGGIAERAAALAEAGWEKIVGPLSELAGLAWDAIKDAGAALADMATAGANLAAVAWANASGPLATIAGLTWDNLKDAATYIKGVADAAAPALPTMQDLSVEFFTLGGNADKVREAIEKIITVLKPFAEQDLAEAKQAAHDLNEELKPLLEELKKWEPVLRPLAIALGALTLAGFVPLALAVAGVTLALGPLIDMIRTQAVAEFKALEFGLETLRIMVRNTKEDFEKMAGAIGRAMSDIYITILPYIDMIKGLFEPLMKIGSGIISGIVDGIQAGLGAVMQAAHNMVDAIEGAIPSWIPHSPSKAGVLIGQGFIWGVAKGMEDEAPGMLAKAAAIFDSVKNLWSNDPWFNGGDDAMQQLETYMSGDNVDPQIAAAYAAWRKGQGPMPYSPNQQPSWVGGTSITPGPAWATPNVGDKSGNGTAQTTWNGSYWAQNSGLADGGSVPKDNFYGFGYSAANPAPLVVNIENFNGTTQADLNQSVGGLAFSLAAKGIL